MSTILIFVLKAENLIKVVYTQGNSTKQTLEKYPNCSLETHGGQVQIFNKEQICGQNDPLLAVPTSRTIIKYVGK